jgi:hypothetical protein
MIHLALLLFLMQAGARGETGVVSGTLKLTSGAPAQGIRVTATEVPKPGDPPTGLKLLSLAATDESGNYRLEDIPPGRYYIAAGRLELPTYYPGTINVGEGTVVVIEAGSRTSKIDFVLKDVSTGRGVAGFTIASGPGLQISIPVQVSIDGGGQAPVLVGNYFPILRLKETMGRCHRTAVDQSYCAGGNPVGH